MFNPDMMRKLMKQMNMKAVEAVRVEIHTPSKKIVIENPEVTSVNMMGETVFQVKGSIKEEAGVEILDDDVDLVAEQSGVSKDEARKALEASNGDIAKAIEQLRG